MSHKYQNFYEDLKLSGKAPRTVETYEYHLHKLEKYYNKKPDKINEEELRKYLLDMKDVKHYSECFFKQAISSFRFYYWKMLNKHEWKTLKFIKPQKQKKLPDVLSREEVKLIMSSIRIPRHYAVLFTIYSLGLRISEALNLSVRDIDSKRMLVHVREGKGKKDRFIPLPQKTLSILRKHWITHKNPVLIFPAPGRGGIHSNTSINPIPISSVQNVLREVVIELKIKKWVHPHTLRHSYATHLMESGVHLRLIQQYLGHSSPKTTVEYMHLSPYAQNFAVNAIEKLMSEF